MTIHNVHERVLDVSPDEIGQLLAGVGRPGDRVWPSRSWPPMHLDRPLDVGATGGHGPIRYTVTDYTPGRRVEFTFAPGQPIRGTHTFGLTGAGPGRCRVRHELSGHALGAGHLVWPLAVRWLHDACIADLFDRLERETGVGPATPARHSPWVRVLLRAEALGTARTRRSHATRGAGTGPVR